MLLIDLGNSRMKWLFSEAGQMSDYSAFFYKKSGLQILLEKNLINIKPQKVALSSVGGSAINAEICDWFDRHWGVKVARATTQKQQLNVVNAYQDVSAMGVDRWLAMLAAYHQHQQAVCVIDCGSAVTCDVITQQAQHLGGLIMPGLTMMQNALLAGAQGVNACLDSHQSHAILQNRTQLAVSSGCINLLITGLEGLFKKYEQQVEGDLLCVVTGGDGQLLANEMQINCIYERDLVLLGLNLVSQTRDVKN